MRKQHIFLIFSLFLIALLPISHGSNFYDVNFDNRYCMVGGDCTLNNLTVNNLTAYSITSVNINVTGNLDMLGYSIFNISNITGINLDISGNATFNGTFDTTCLYCDGNDTYFNGNIYSAGNITAPNIEVMESLIVHGNSTCTGTATICGGLTFGQCGWWFTSRPQYGCRWTGGSGGSCIGTATPCEDVSTAVCGNQLGCSLTVGSAGFVIDGSGLNGSFDINTTGTIFTNNIYSTNWSNVTITEDQIIDLNHTSDYCANGDCEGSLNVPGNVTINNTLKHSLTESSIYWDNDGVLIISYGGE